MKKNERESKTGTEAAEGKSRDDTMAVEVYLKMESSPLTSSYVYMTSPHLIHVSGAVM